MLAGDRKVELDRVELPAPGDRRNAIEPVREEARELHLGCKRRVMVDLDVRHHRDLWREQRNGPVRLVALNDEPARAHAGVPAELRNHAAHDEGRVVAELAKDVRDHRCGGRLPVRAAYDDCPAQRDKLCEEFSARSPRHPTEMSGRDHGLESVGNAGLTAHVDFDSGERVHEDRLTHIPAPYLGTPGARDVRVGGEACAADADEVEPPARERRVAHRRPSPSRTTSSAISAAASGRASARMASLIRRSRSRIGEKLVDEPGDERELPLTHDDRASSLLEVARVQGLVVGGRIGIRDEDGRYAGRGELPHRATGARDSEVGCGERASEAVRRRDQDVVVARHSRPDEREVPLPCHVQDRRPSVPVRVGCEFVQRLRPCQPSEERDDRPVERKPEVRPALLSGHTEMRFRDRATDHPVLRAVPAGDLVGEEHPARERRRQAVREPEVRIRLGERRRNPTHPRRQHHWSGDVPATAEDDVRPAPPEDASAGERRPYRLEKGANESEAEPPRKPRDGKRVELESGLRNQPRLDAVGRPGERHRHPAVAQRLGDGERRSNVACGSARRDQAHELRRLAHSRRC